MQCSSELNVAGKPFSGGYKHHNWLIYSFIRKLVRDLKMKDRFSVLVVFISKMVTNSDEKISFYHHS